MLQSQVQDQPGGMNDGKIRNKLKRIDQTGKAGKEHMGEAPPGKAECGGCSRCRALLFLISIFLFIKFEAENVFLHFSHVISV